ncbi:hypothetical protein EAO82_16885 [Halopseudomonas pelagia]|uniref:Uncharacterized protein n=1 Tax=Halopseudomonas pelagia TaxID=553151 RepID=A0AA91Z463_9GAMM|nr:hypothetical protein CO192_20170 [Halopseudomonas pelagia]QFY57892.1 hypothetical protein EAO82_16885 [Halopseudomonas pelagia]
MSLHRMVGAAKALRRAKYSPRNNAIAETGFLRQTIQQQLCSIKGLIRCLDRLYLVTVAQNVEAGPA